MESKKANWAILGGIPLPIVNSNAFTNNEIKLAKVRPKLVVNVPMNEDEKRVKVSRIPIVLKYLKNNWIWHSKNGLEKTSSENGKKEERRNTAEIDTRDWTRYRRFQSALMNAANAEQQQNGQNAMETREDTAALQLLEDQNRIRRLRRDLVKEEIERNEARMREGPSTSKAPSNGDIEDTELWAKKLGEKKEIEPPKCSKIFSMAARAMEEDEEMEKQISASQKQCSSSSSSNSPISMMTIRNGDGQMRMDEDEEEMDGQNGHEKDQRGPHSPPPAKMGRNC